MAGEFSFDFNRATIIVRHGIWSGLSNSVLNMLMLRRKTCIDKELYSFDFISHAERKNAEDAFNHLVRCSKHICCCAAAIFLFLDGWMVDGDADDDGCFRFR